MELVETEELSCSQLEEKIKDVFHNHTKYFYIGYTTVVSPYLQRTGPKSAEWCEIRECFSKEAVCYCWVTDPDLERYSEQRLIDQYKDHSRCLNESPRGKHRPGVVYVVVYVERQLLLRRVAVSAPGTTLMAQDPWRMALLRRIQEIKEKYQDSETWAE